MRILHVLSNLYAGGATLACLRLHEALLKNNIDSKLLLLDQNIEGIRNSHSFYDFYLKQQKGISLIGRAKRKASFILGLSHEKFVTQHRSIVDKILKSKKEGLEVFTFPISNYNITEHPEYKNADIIHLHWVSDGFIDHKIFFPSNKKPIVWTLHDMNPFTGGCHFSENCTNFTNNCDCCPDLEGTGYEGYAKDMLNYKASGLAKVENLHIVSPSKWLKEKSSQSRIFSRFAQYLIPYPIDDSIYRIGDKKIARTKLGLLNSGKKFILFSAFNLHNKRKGFRLLQETLGEMKHLHDQFELLIMGRSDGGIEYNEFKIHNFGFVKDEQLKAEIYRCADLFVIPSIADNLPNTVLESLMCGTPVLGFTIGGVPDMIEHGKNGMLIDNLSKNGLKNALVNFVSHDVTWNNEQIGAAAFSRYNYKEVATQYCKLYAACLNTEIN